MRKVGYIWVHSLSGRSTAGAEVEVAGPIASAEDAQRIPACISAHLLLFMPYKALSPCNGAPHV